MILGPLGPLTSQIEREKRAPALDEATGALNCKSCGSPPVTDHPRCAWCGEWRDGRTRCEDTHSDPRGCGGTEAEHLLAGHPMLRTPTPGQRYTV